MTEAEKRDLLAGIEKLMIFGKSDRLEGGLRCTTVHQTLTCEIVIKRGDHAELKRQMEYVLALPAHLSSYFPRSIALTEVEPGQGVAVMERITGRNLHELAADIFLDQATKLICFKKVLTALGELHRPAAETLLRNAGAWKEKVRARILKLPVAHDRTFAALDRLPEFEDSIEASIIHGDAQGGNIMITTEQEVRFIDPLGGSGTSPGDPLYDLSRLWHWFDAAGLCYEQERDEGIIRSRRQSALLEFRAEVLPLIAELVAERDRRWFHLYCAFHLSGKLSNFTGNYSREVLMDRLIGHLRKVYES